MRLIPSHSSNLKVMPKLKITELQKEEEKAWDSYVHNSNSSTFYHQIGWRNMVEKTYKHKPIYLIAKEESEIKGVLPLLLMRSRFFGKKRVSVSFAPYGGVCADNETVKNVLVEKPFFQKESFTKEILYFIHDDEAKRNAKECGVDYLERRGLNKNEIGLAVEIIKMVPHVVKSMLKRIWMDYDEKGNLVGLTIIAAKRYS